MIDTSNSQLNSNSTPNSTKSIVTILLVFIVVHGLLIGFGLVNDDSLLSADRSTSRNATIAYVFDVEKIGGDNVTQQTTITLKPMPRIGDRVLNVGHAGDFIVSGVIIKLTNPNILVLFQLLLTLFSTLSVFALLMYFGFSEKPATLATLFYLLLPGSLLPPHQLGNEAWFIPCTIIGCYLLIISSRKDGVNMAFVAGLLLFSVAIFVRPQLTLYPLLLIVIYCLFSAKKLNTIFLTILPVSLLFSAIWMIFVVSKDGQFTLGAEDRSVGMTFYDVAEQMAMFGEFEFNSDAAYKNRTMPVSDFVRLVIDNPYSYLRQRTISMVNFVVNPGANSFVGHHLNYIENNSSKYYWQELRARVGIVESLLEIVKRGPMFALLIISTALIWCLAVCFAVVGLLPFIKDKNTGWFAKSLLLSLVVYQVAVVATLSVAARWQQRSLLDFVIIILALYGLKIVYARFSLKEPRHTAVAGH